MKKEHAVILAKLTLAMLIASAFEAINFRLVYTGFYSGNWFLALYFPILLGMSVFGITIYFCTNGTVWKRWLLTLIGGVVMTFFWLAAFAIISGRISHWTDVVFIQNN
jgi:hypothetical protein